MFFVSCQNYNLVMREKRATRTNSRTRRLRCRSDADTNSYSTTSHFSHLKLSLFLFHV